MDFFNAADLVLFKKYLWDYLQMALFYPSNLKVLAAALVLGFVVFTIVFTKVHASSGSTSAGTLTGIFASFFGLLSLLVMPALARIYIMKTIAKPGQYDLLTLVATVFILLAMIVPFTRMLFRTTYAASLGAWIMSLLFTFMVVVGTGYFYDNLLSEQKKKNPEQLNEPMPMPSEAEVKETLKETKEQFDEAADKAKSAVEGSSEKVKDSLEQAEEALKEEPSP